MPHRETKLRNSGWRIAVLGIAVLAALFGWFAIDSSRRTEALLRAELEALLARYGMEGEIASISGRDVRLRGHVISEVGREALIREVAALPGVRRVSAEALRVSPPPERSPQLSITLSPTAVTAAGVMPEASQAEVLEALAAIANGRSVLDGFSAVERVSAAPWLAGVLDFLPQFAENVESGSLSVTAGTLRLEGIIGNEERRAALTGSATMLTTGLMIVNDLAIAEPLLPEPDIRLTLSGGSLTLSGNAPEEVIPELVAQAASAYGAPNVNNALNPALTTSPSWLAALLAALPELHGRAEVFDITVTNGVLRLRGTTRDEAAHQAFVAWLSERFRGVFEVRDEVERLPPEPEALNLTVREAEGTIVLSGTVSRAVQTNLLNTLARRNLASELRISEAVEVPPWLFPLIRQLPTYLTTVSDAAVEVDGGVRLLGRVNSNAERSALEASIRSAVGNEVTIVNALVAIGVPFRLRWQLEGDTLELAGNVSAALAEALMARAAALSVSSVSDSLARYDEVREPAWLEQVLTLLELISTDAAMLTADLSRGAVQLEASVTSEAAKARLTAALAALAAEGVDVAAQLALSAAPDGPIPAAEAEVAAVAEAPIATPEGSSDSAATIALPVPTPIANLRIDGSAEGVMVRGVVPDAAARDALEAAFGEAAVAELQIDSAAPEAPWLPELIALAQTLRAGVERFGLELDGSTLYLGGVVADAEARERVAAAARAALGPSLTVINRLSLQPLAPLLEDGK